MREQR
jgi:hypothetical protein